MEPGVIESADDTESGLIAPDAGGDDVLFTAAVFEGAWRLAVPGLPVRFDRVPGTDQASFVVIDHQSLGAIVNPS